MKKKKIFFLLTAFLLSLFITLLAAECFMRIFFPQPEPIKWFTSDKKYFFVNKKNFIQKFSYPNTDFVMGVKTNSLGHRDKEYDLSEKNERRVLLLGDSFTFGQGQNVENIFDSKLEYLLNQTEERYIVINSAVAGWGTLQEITYAKEHFELFQPDVIVITFCGNDPYDDFRYINKLYNFEKGFFYFPGKIFLRNHSHLYRFLATKNYMRIYSLVMGKKIEEDRGKGKRGSLDWQSATFCTEEDWNRSVKLIKDFHSDFLAFNPNGIILIQATNPLDETIRKHLNALSNTKTLVYVDLYEDVHKLNRSEWTNEKRLRDNHWSSAMHTISARKLYKTIIELLD